LGVGCQLTGLHTLKIKETDRLLALKTELEKLGAVISVTNDSLDLEGESDLSFINSQANVIEIATYEYHRIAMAFAPLGLKFSLAIDNPMVVTKSFPSFWENIGTMGVTVDLK
jgi:3-phosphoshikimate 1-carboxyvinyltransferase